MTVRGLRFTDTDENRLELWLKQDRIQLVVIDSRPELEAGELRRFASIVFAEYVGRDLSDRLTAARRQLAEARDRSVDRGGDRKGHRGDELAAVLDGALQAIDDVTAAIAVPASMLLPDPEMEWAPEAEGVPAVEPLDPAATPVGDAAAPYVQTCIPVPTLSFRNCRPYPSLKPPRKTRKAAVEPSPETPPEPTTPRKPGGTGGGNRAGEPSAPGWS